MNAKSLISKLESLSVKAWVEARHVEKLTDLARDYANACDDFNVPENENFPRSIASQKHATRRLNQLSLTLLDIDSSLQEVGWELDRIVDILEDLVPPERPKKKYNAPDAWR
jgi:hypothetical protein